MTQIDEYRSAVGRDLHRMRRQRDMSIRDLAAACARHGVEIAIAALSRVERGLRDLRAPEILALSRALDVAPIELMTPTPADSDTLAVPVAVADGPVRWDVARRWTAGECDLDASAELGMDSVHGGILPDITPTRRAAHSMSPVAEIAWQMRRLTPHTGHHRICVEMTADEIWVSVDGGGAEEARMQAIREAEYQRRVVAELDTVPTA